MVKTLVLAAVVAVLLSGCSSLQNRAQLAALDDSTCIGYGFQRGTDNFAICMMQLDQVRQADNRASRARFGQAMRQLAAGLNRPSNRVNCNATSTRFGNTTTTNAYCQ